MSTPYDPVPERDTQPGNGGFPGHCTYCGELCETCAGQLDQRDAPEHY